MERFREPAGLNKAVFQHCACTAITFNSNCQQLLKIRVQRSTVLMPPSAIPRISIHKREVSAWYFQASSTLKCKFNLHAANFKMKLLFNFERLSSICYLATSVKQLFWNAIKEEYKHFKMYLLNLDVIWLVIKILKLLCLKKKLSYLVLRNYCTTWCEAGNEVMNEWWEH